MFLISILFLDIYFINLDENYIYKDKTYITVAYC